MPCLSPLRALLILLCAVAAPAIAAPRPVVLELFTSNSCSSCPPAYDLLNSLASKVDDDQVQLIRLDEHVDYWNQLNWVDRYSSAAYTARQQRYAREVFGADRIYTPQLVVNGTQEMVGSDRRRMLAVIAQPASPAVDALAISVQPQGNSVLATVANGNVAPGHRLWFAMTQDKVISHVGAGENSGRTLREDGVVRYLQPASPQHSKSSDKDSWTVSLPIPHDAHQATLHVVAFVQQTNTLQINAAGIANVPSNP
ncbi:MAG: DUF1223 domain-containing protein [Salinisphaera sp.]|jgi:hypothetical protein|nr:DUF1223 domain-containing protein [Salinisphaera sp.]